MSGQNNGRKGILLESGTNEVEFLEFTVGGQNFGINVAKVTQALVWKDQNLTVLPNLQSYQLGTVPFRKQHIPVMDLRSYLGLTDVPVNPDKQLLLVMEFNRKSNGYVVDGVEEIQRVSWDKFVAFTESGVMQGDPCIIGTVTIEDRVIMILDMEGMMAQIDNSVHLNTYASQVQPTEEYNRSDVRIVYCEDSPIIQKMTAKILREAGFTNVTIFPNGRGGLLHLLTTGGDEVDIILSDIEMPQMDGLSFCKSVKSMADTCNIPFIFFSSLINDQMKRKCDLVKADDAFSKPEIHTIVDAIDRHYKRFKAGLTKTDPLDPSVEIA